jgi:hypothetical protein
MMLRSLLAAALLTLAAPALLAQTAPEKVDTTAGQAGVGLYLNPIATIVTNSVADNSSLSFLGPNSTSRTFWGVNYGVFYEFAHSGSINFGLDLRGTDLHADNAALKDLLFGVRVSGSNFHGKWKPYGEATIGGGWTKAQSSKISIHKIEYRFMAGADYPIGRHVDVRAAEVGYGSLDVISAYTVGTGGTMIIPASKLISITSGLVFRF